MLALIGFVLNAKVLSPHRKALCSRRGSRARQQQRGDHSVEDGDPDHPFSMALRSTFNELHGERRPSPNSTTPTTGNRLSEHCRPRVPFLALNPAGSELLPSCSR
jgi:hypothetical protein